VSAEQVIRDIVDRLDAAGIPHMLTGSFAAAFHGVPRATQDIDLVIAATANQLSDFIAALPPTGYYLDRDTALEALRAEGMFNIIDLELGWKVDLVVQKGRPFSQVEFERRQPVSAWGRSLDVATVEDLIVAKLEWAKLGESARQVEDVAALLRLRGDELDWDYIERWISELGLRAQWNDARRRAPPDPPPPAND
jgi:hypothetical protein